VLTDEALRGRLLVHYRTKKIEPPGRIERILKVEGSAMAGFSARPHRGLQARCGAGLGELAGEVAEFDVVVVGGAPQHREGLRFSDVVSLDEGSRTWNRPRHFRRTVNLIG
jgi:hypothetical protein